MVLKKKLAIVANVNNHQKYYITQIKLLYRHYKITIFTTKFLFKQIEYLANEFECDFPEVHLVESNNLYDILSANLNIINDFDYLIIDEYYGLPTQILYLKIEPKLIMTIHNVNKWFYPSFNFNFKQFIALLLRKMFLKKIDLFIVLNPIIKKYLVNNKFTSKKVTVIPFSISTTYKATKVLSEIPTITIPGMIDSRRRNYDIVIDAYENFLENTHAKNLKIVFLGSVIKNTNSKINKRIDEINNKGGNIKYWNEFIEEDEFTYYLESTHYILLNLNTFYKTTASSEIYGITKETGMFYSAVEYRKPIILSEESVIPSIYNKFSIRYYDEKSLSNIFKQISENKIDIPKSIQFRNDYTKLIENEIRKFNIEITNI